MSPTDSRRKKKTVKRKARTNPWIILLIPACLILVFGYFLYRERESPSDEIPIPDDSASVTTEESSEMHAEDALEASIPGAEVTREYKLYFGNEDFNSSMADCDDVFPVFRERRGSEDILKQSLKALLEGPSSEESGQGYYTSLNPGISLLDCRNEGGTVYADFSSDLEKNLAGSCQTMAVRAQIVRTLLQFEGVEKVVVLVEGTSEDILQP